MVGPRLESRALITIHGQYYLDTLSQWVIGSPAVAPFQGKKSGRVCLSLCSQVSIAAFFGFRCTRLFLPPCRFRKPNRQPQKYPRGDAGEGFGFLPCVLNRHLE